MKTAVWVGLAIGVAIAVGLIAWQGASTVARLLGSTEWRLIFVASFAIPNLLLAAASWRLLFPPDATPRFGLVLRAIWIGFSINLLLPVASIGGDVVRARLVSLWTGKPREAVASVVVDKTVQVATLPLLGLIGIALLLRVLPGSGSIGAAVGAVVLLAAIVAVILLVQKVGVFGFLASYAQRFARRWSSGELSARASGLDDAVRDLYRSRAKVLAALGLRLLARLSLAGEVWLAARLLGHPIGILDAVLLKTLVIVARGVAFPVPGGVGVQEGSFVALGSLIGLPPDAALATSLAIRVREVVSSVPGVLAWEIVEGRGFWRRRAA